MGPVGSSGPAKECPVTVRPPLATVLAAALAGSAVVALPAAAVGPDGSVTRDSVSSRPAGTVVKAERLKKSLWVPKTTRAAYKLTYVTTNAAGRRALSTGTVFIPKGKAPRGGWPVISWTHGTSGLGDACAPSRMGPTLPGRDLAYLRTWMSQGYAIVATDYAGLGTADLPAYLNSSSEAHNAVDMVRAGHSYTTRRLPASQRLSNRWVVVGQSQGGGAAISTARHATAFSGRDLRYLGAVGTGVPAYIEGYVSLLGPKVPPVALPPGLTAYLTYIVESLRRWRPDLGIDGILTSTGRKYLKLARTSCVVAFDKRLKGVSVGDYFTRPLAALPNWTATINGYLKMPESGFDKPFFMGHGLTDTDVPYAATAAYAARLKANAQPVTFITYRTDHSGALTRSQADTLPFVRALFARPGR